MCTPIVDPLSATWAEAHPSDSVAYLMTIYVGQVFTRKAPPCLPPQSPCQHTHTAEQPPGGRSEGREGMLLHWNEAGRQAWPSTRSPMAPLRAPLPWRSLPVLMVISFRCHALHRWQNLPLLSTLWGPLRGAAGRCEPPHSALAHYFPFFRGFETRCRNCVLLIITLNRRARCIGRIIPRYTQRRKN